MFAKIQKFSEQDEEGDKGQEEIFSKQYNISSTKMYSKLLELHAVDSSN